MPASIGCSRILITWWRTFIMCCRLGPCSPFSQAGITAIGKLHFWVTLVGVNLTFFPHHFLGLAGMPRRVADYPNAFAGWNFVSSVGAYISGFGLLIFFFGIVWAFVRKERVADNPWGVGATTLEWTLSSPPPFHQFERLPRIM